MLNALVTGTWRMPLFLRNTLDEATGEPLETLAHRRAKPVVSEQTAQTLRGLLAGVVANGTAARRPCRRPPPPGRPERPRPASFGRVKS